jgi:hypothetical protein
MKQLRRTQEPMSRSDSSRLREFEGGIIGAVAAAVDSGSEDALDYGRKMGAGRQESMLRLSTNMMSTGGSLRLMKRSYDEDHISRIEHAEENDGPLTKSIDSSNYDPLEDRSAVESNHSIVIAKNNLFHDSGQSIAR